MTCKPFPQSFWVYEGLLCAGCYPGDLDSASAMPSSEVYSTATSVWW